MRKIVVLDGYTTNPGDLDWKSIEGYGELTIYERTPPALIVERARNAEIILTNKTRLSRGELKALPELKLICVMATGHDVIDSTAARELGIAVTNVKGYSTPSVVQHTFSLILELLNDVGLYSKQVRDGKWHSNSDFSFWEKPIYELEGKTLGVVGYGNIGKSVAKVALAFGMKVLASRRSERGSGSKEVNIVSVEELFGKSDIVSLHCPLTSDNHHMVNGSLLSRMKPNALLINTARGGLVDPEALLQALSNKVIAGAALDVLEQEPPQDWSDLFSIRECIITPHQAWASFESRKRLIEGLYANIAAYLENAPINVVN